jgi:hypothetical protein
LTERILAGWQEWMKENEIISKRVEGLYEKKVFLEVENRNIFLELCRKKNEF